MPLQRRIPKRGFTNIFKKQFAIVNVGDLDGLAAEGAVGPDELVFAGLVRKNHHPVKLLANGEISSAVTIRVHKASASAVQKIEAAGGKVELIMPKREGK
jgi:large subunit ribosomal protein L15